jgi:hypothetical protein
LTVNIINEPTLTVKAYQRGTQINAEDLTDAQTQLVVDQGSYFAFKVDDIEERQSHINWMTMATDQGAYRLKDSFDTNILAFINTTVSTSQYGTNAAPIDVGFDAGEVDPANVLARLARLLDDQNVPEENRWAVAPPIFYEQMNQTGAKLMEVQVTGDSGSPMRLPLNNGRVSDRMVHGFRLYKSNNVPTPSGSNATQNVLAGHMSAVATANHIAKVENLRLQTSFADMVRGLHIFGRTALREVALAKAWIKID